MKKNIERIWIFERRSDIREGKYYSQGPRGQYDCKVKIDVSENFICINDVEL